MKNLRLRVLLILLSLASAQFVIAGDMVVFGMSPIMGPLEMERVFGRLARLLDEGLPQEVVFRTRRGRLNFDRAFNNNEFDIVMLHPFDFLRSEVYDDYLPVVRKKGELKPVFVAIDNNIQSLQDLRGKSIAFPPASGFVAQLGRQKLRSIGLEDTDYRPIAHSNFNSCLQSIINKTADACLTIRNIVREYTRDNNINFRMIGETESVPQVILIVHRKLEPQLETIRQFLLALNNNEQGRILLNLLLLDELESLSINDINTMRNHPLFIQMQ